MTLKEIFTEFQINKIQELNFNLWLVSQKLTDEEIINYALEFAFATKYYNESFKKNI